MVIDQQEYHARDASSAMDHVKYCTRRNERILFTAVREILESAVKG